MFDKIRTTAKANGCSNSKVIRDAIETYYNVDTSTDNQGLQAYMQQEIEFLRSEQTRLQNLNTALVINNMSWWKRLRLRKTASIIPQAQGVRA